MITDFYLPGRETRVCWEKNLGHNIQSGCYSSPGRHTATNEVPMERIFIGDYQT